MTAFRPIEAGAPEIEVRPDIVRGPKVFVDGLEIAPLRGRGRPHYPIRLADGSEQPLTLHGAFLGLRARFGDREYPVERRLHWIELFLVVLPLALLTIRPPLGALVGALGVMTNLVVMKSALSPALRAILAVGVVASGAVLLLGLAATG
jgi:hypothetical protein